MRKLLALVLVPPLVMIAGCTDAPTEPIGAHDLAGPAFAFDDQGTGEAGVSSSFVAPSTNAVNRAKQVPGREGQDAPYVEWQDIDVGRVTLRFTNNTNSLAFFEYRIDGEQVGTSPHSVVNTQDPHLTTGEVALLDDVIHPGVAVDGRGEPDPVEVVRTLHAEHTVEIRLALGGERDWDFDWTTFYVPTTTEARDRCRDGGWRDLGFGNQGACIRDANENRTTVLATGHATALGEWSGSTWDIEVDFEVLEQRGEVRGNVAYVNHTAGTSFTGAVSCFATIEDEEGFGEYAVFGASANEDSDWDHLIFYVQDNGPGGSVEPRDRFRPVPSAASDVESCEVAPTDRLYRVFEGNMNVRGSG